MKKLMIPVKIIVILVFINSCNSDRFFSSKEEFMEAELSSVYMGLDMNKSFSETMRTLQEQHKKVDTVSSIIDENLTHLINIQEADSAIGFCGNITIQKTDSTFDDLQTTCEAHFKDSIFYLLQVEPYAVGFEKLDEGEIYKKIKKLYSDKYGPCSVDTSTIAYTKKTEETVHTSSFSAEEGMGYIYQKTKTYYDVIGWNFPQVDIYIEKTWDEYKEWYTENLTEAAIDINMYTSVNGGVDLNRVLRNINVRKTKTRQTDIKIKIYYVNKKLQNKFDEAKRKEELERSKSYQKLQDDMKKTEKLMNESKKKDYNSQKI